MTLVISVFFSLQKGAAFTVNDYGDGVSTMPIVDD